jgi:hypothetical protein
MKYQGKEQNQKILLILYIFTVSYSLLESQQKIYINLFIQIMYQSENGFKNKNQSEFQAK